MNRNDIFEYDIELAPPDDPSVAKKNCHKTWCLNRVEDLILQKNLNRQWVVLYGIDLSTPYVIYKVTVAIYGFIYPTNNEGQTVRARRKEF